MENLLRSGLSVLIILVCVWDSRAQSSDSLRLQAFYQGQTGNCASVALIKAAIDRYGLGQVFDTIRTGSLVRIKLRSGQELTVTDAERRQATGAAMFVRCDTTQTGINRNSLPSAEAAQIVQYANLCYAVMAKFIATYGEYDCLRRDNTTADPEPVASFTAALATLADGVCSDNVYRHLGLEVLNAKHVEFDPSLDLTHTPGVVVYSNKHAVMLWRKYFDFHGDWITRSRRGQCETAHFQAKFYFVLK